MKILILTQYYPPEHGAPQNRLHDLAKRWKKSGHDITVLTAMPNYPKGEVFQEYAGKLFCREEIDSIKVVRSWIFASRTKSTIPQLISYFSFVFSSLFAGLFLCGRTDLVICESPPLFLGFTALKLKYLKRAKMIMNISDLWPESAVQLGIIGPGMALRILEAFERLLYKESMIVSCQTEGIASGVRKSCPAADAFLFPNGVDLDMFGPVEPSAKLKKKLEFPEEYFVVGYGGNHGRSQALSQVLAAADKLRNEKIFFALTGDGPEKDELVKKALEMKLDNLRFYPACRREEMSTVQALWDLALVPLKNIELFDGARPSKMFELMAGEIPFIFCGKGEGADLAVESGCAIAVPPEDAEKLAGAIKRLAAMKPVERKAMGKAGHDFVSSKFNREKIAADFMAKIEGSMKK